MAWVWPVGALALLLLAAARAHAFHITHILPEPSTPRRLPDAAKGPAKVPTKIHHNFMPGTGQVEVAADPSWSWNGETWLHNGKPEYPAGRFLHGTPGKGMDGWVYDWHLLAWVEPGNGDKLVHKNFYPPTGAVEVQGDKSWKWDGSIWTHNGKPEFPDGKSLMGKGFFSGWHYDWNQAAWVEPTSAPTLTRKASEQGKSTIREVSSIKESAPTQTQVASAIRELKSDPDPHPQKIADVAHMANNAGLKQTASTLTDISVKKASEKNSPIVVVPVTPSASSISVASSTGTQVSVSPIKVTSIKDSDYKPSSITATTVQPLSSAQRSTQALQESLKQFSHAADAPTQIAPAPMQFEPEVMQHADVSQAMQFEPEIVEHGTPLTSPLDGVDDNAWSMFAGVFDDSSNKMSDQWILGRFQIGARRLEDLGMAHNARQATSPSGVTRWVADFNEPLSLQIFVNDPNLQYETFIKEMKYLSEGIDKRGAEGKIPTTIHGTFPTKSGLMAVAKLAGFQGLDSFVKDKGDWDKFPKTRDAYLRANEIF